MTTPRRFLSADSIAGDPIKNPAGDKIADVKDLMIDIATGHVAYLVVSYGGVLGLGDKLFAIPWSVVVVDQDDHALVVDLDEEVMANAPGFDKDDWPDFGDLDWQRQIDDHYRIGSH